MRTSRHSPSRWRQAHADLNPAASDVVSRCRAPHKCTRQSCSGTAWTWTQPGALKADRPSPLRVHSDADRRAGGTAPPRRFPPESKRGSSEARSIVHHSHTGRSAWGNAPQASDIPLALGGVCGAFQRHSPPCSPRLTDRANARRGRVSLRGRDRIRRARGSRALAAAKSAPARRRRPGARAHWDGSAHARVSPRH